MSSVKFTHFKHRVWWILVAVCSHMTSLTVKMWDRFPSLKSSPVPLHTASPFLFLAPGDRRLLSANRVLFSLEFCMKGTTRFSLWCLTLAKCICDSSLCSMHLCFFSFTAKWFSIVWMYHSLFIPPPGDACLGCGQFGTAVTNSVMNSHTRVFA